MTGHDNTIAIVVLTHNRLRMVRKCYERVLARTSAATTEMVIWDNGSTDGTAAFFESVDDPRIRYIRHPENIGQNAYAEAVKLTSAPYIIEIDDDVTNAPERWDETMLDAFLRLPDVGFLAADLEDDPNDVASHIRHHVRSNEYVAVERNGVNLLDGPAGGGCAMTSREIYERVGGFPQQHGKTFYLEDEAYIKRVQRHGYRATVLRDLRVHHTGGEYYTDAIPAKEEYWRRFQRSRDRRENVKAALVKVPLVRRLNGRFGWFLDPDSDEAQKWKSPRERSGDT